MTTDNKMPEGSRMYSVRVISENDRDVGCFGKEREARAFASTSNDLRVVAGRFFTDEELTLRDKMIAEEAYNTGMSTGLTYHDDFEEWWGEKQKGRE